MKNLTLISHPLLKHKLGLLRDQKTSSAEFRHLVGEISTLLVYEAMKDWKDFNQHQIQTPIAPTNVERIENPPVIVSILRAGMGMLDPILNLMPFCAAGFIGIYRDKFIKNTVEYYFKMPEDIAGKATLLCDPLISSADTIVAAIERLKSYQVEDIKILCILISRKGYERIQKHFPKIPIYAIHLEEQVNEQGYLVPGLGDAGDRLYRTK